ncbi:NAD(P)/FAD-dependent oxidoreductase [Paractinoplanes brasiliensis]|uniref:Glycine/D-amino acid oxidase-like deaminating enzyme n=1 Tax=Paractinoplanes brasiliensis TaxID=52695 RepID=A0A4R6JA85_9ACTN|nr:FAD-binding oxidoreductase [Actinoplanes brasiliensis]TDO31366.1 glycine/D-amino acid oxidase-like deaminating enzyme [Actinoplanes brasiliensis]GID28303.1 FAD-dependent oxidoreductase [Actinoplanes brasiliensis]
MTPSFWLSTLGPVTPRPPLPGDRSYDVAIAGGGYTGLWTAYYLSQAAPSLRVAVLEAQYCGFGASGRNGGWASGLFPVSEAKLARRYGPERALAMHVALAGAVDEVGRVAAAEGIDCHYAKGGTISLARSPAQLRRARRANGFLPREEAAAICNATDVLGGVYSPDCAALHPARLVRGLASTVAERGVDIYEDTRVLSLSRGSVVTDRGTVTAGTVVRALEGYTAQLPGHRRALAPVYSLMIATEPLPASDWERIGLARRETFTDERHMIIYGQRTADDRFAFGGRGAPYHFGSRVEPSYDQVPSVFESLRRTLGGMFGIKPEIAYRWGGPLGIPRDWMPSVGLRDGLAWAGGYVGDGVAAANLAGRTLADLIAGHETERTGLPWVGHRSRPWEPEPIRWLGINAALRATTFRDALEKHPAPAR